jgi:hypothetical protein
MTDGTLEVEKLAEVVDFLLTMSEASDDSGNGSPSLDKSRKELELLKLQEKVVKIKKKHKSKKTKVQ